MTVFLCTNRNFHLQPWAVFQPCALRRATGIAGVQVNQAGIGSWENNRFSCIWLVLTQLKRTKVGGCWLLLVFYLCICRFSNICRNWLDLKRLITRETEQSGLPATVLLVTVSNPKEIRVFILKWKGGVGNLYSVKTLIICPCRFSSSDMNVKNVVCCNMEKLLFSALSTLLLSFLCCKLQKKCFGCSFFWNLCFCLFSCLTTIPLTLLGFQLSHMVCLRNFPVF